MVDSNGNYRTIGTAKTDATGTYRLTWTPDISGEYTVIATFAGTNGYYGSYAEDGFTVMEPIVTTAPTEQPLSAADIYFVPAIAGLFVLVVIVLVMLAILLARKRP